MIKPIHVVTERTPFREGVADLFVSKLTVQVVSLNVGGGDRGIWLCGIVDPLPAIVMVTSGISKAKLVLFVHVYFVVQIGEVSDWGSMGAVPATILCVVPHAHRIKGLFRNLEEAGCIIRGNVNLPLLECHKNY
eukprot:1149813-Pelagomonas_calceolata.AAC.2